MRITTYKAPEWNKKFFWFPVYVSKNSKEGQWLWWESFLVKESLYGDGSPIRYIRELDGSNVFGEED